MSETPAPAMPAPHTPPVPPGQAVIQAAATGAPDAVPTRRPAASPAALVLAILAIGYTLWVAQGVILPVLLAMFFALIGNPVIRALRRLYVPRFLAALLVLAGGLAGAGLLGQQLLAPAIDWMQEAPRQMRQLGNELRDLAKPVHEANRVAEDIARLAGGEDGSRRQDVVRTQVDDPYAILNKAPRVVASVLAVVLLTFFFMVFGEDLQRRAIALLPTRQRQRSRENMQRGAREPRYCSPFPDQRRRRLSWRRSCMSGLAWACRKRCCGASWRCCSISRRTWGR